MRLIHDIEALKDALGSLRRHEKNIAFVPTMGALHAGHASLMQEAKSSGYAVVVSIFVNPLQFGPKEDFERYPKTLEADSSLCKEAGVDIVFAPSAKTMYPQGFCTSVVVDGLSQKLCGASRPGHFQGVATVVLKLLHLVQPDVAYFGQKDFQQTVVLKRMVQDLSVPCQILVSPTIREPDGLAMSSRNRYLSVQERSKAKVLYEALQAMAKLAQKNCRDPQKLVQEGKQILEQCQELRLDYLEVVSPATLSTPEKTEIGPYIAAVAAWLGQTRLIDNLQLDFPSATKYDSI